MTQLTKKQESLLNELLAELYGAEVSPTLISNVTNSVLDEVQAWQARPLDPVYPIIYRPSESSWARV